MLCDIWSYTVECRYNVVQYTMVFHISLQEVRQNINQRLNPQKTSHSSPWGVSYGLSLVNVLEKIDGVIMALHCTKVSFNLTWGCSYILWGLFQYNHAISLAQWRCSILTAWSLDNQGLWQPVINFEKLMMMMNDHLQSWTMTIKWSHLYLDILLIGQTLLHLNSMLYNKVVGRVYTQIAKFMGPTWGPPGSCRPQIGPMSAPWTLLSG